MTWPAQAAARLDPVAMAVFTVPPTDRQISLDVNREGLVVREHFPPDADVVVFQRPTSGYLVQAIPLLQRRGVAVVVDMDDDLAHIDPRNPAWSVHQPTVRGPHGQQAPNLHNYGNARLACRHADLVTVSTPALADTYGAHGRVATMYNLVPRRYLDTLHDDSDLVGWPGSLHSHPGDLQTMGAAIAQHVAGGGRFKIIGDATGTGRVLGLGADPVDTGVVPLDGWAAAVAELGIGLAPLADTRFNRAKSWLKPLEMSAVGVPWVATDLPEYRRWHATSAGGLLVSKPKHWASALRGLAASADLRAELASAGRSAAALHTIEGNAWRWAEVWTQALANHRARHRLVPKGRSELTLRG
jgi:hypothetical protein